MITMAPLHSSSSLWDLDVKKNATFSSENRTCGSLTNSSVLFLFKGDSDNSCIVLCPGLTSGCYAPAAVHKFHKINFSMWSPPCGCCFLFFFKRQKGSEIFT